MLLLVAAFALGFGSRNIVSGLHPFAMKQLLPASTTPVRVGEKLTIESNSYSNINRTVTVMADGKIKLSMVGIIDVEGQTLSTIESALDKAYIAKGCRQPDVQVFRANADE